MASYCIQQRRRMPKMPFKEVELLPGAFSINLMVNGAVDLSRDSALWPQVSFATKGSGGYQFVDFAVLTAAWSTSFAFSSNSRNTLTTAGSNCVPEQARSSARAEAIGIGSL